MASSEPLLHLSVVDRVSIVHRRPAHKVITNRGLFDGVDVCIRICLKMVPPIFYLIWLASCCSMDSSSLATTKPTISGS